MSPWDSPARGTLAVASSSPGRRERRAVLLWHAVTGALTLAAYSVAGLFATALALAPLAGRRPAGRRVLGTSDATPEAEADRQALPG